MTDAIAVEAMATLIDKEPPHAPVPYYFATKEGWLQNVPTLFGTAHIKAAKWPQFLPDVKESFVLSDELIPRFIFDQATDFFRKVYEAHKTEATTYICRDSEGQYSLFIPTQYVTGASVNHKVEPGEMGTRYPVGTIHSHCNFGAFHSGTDEHDMGKMPGLHATIGYVVREQPEVAVALAVGNARFTVDLSAIIDEDKTLDANGFATAPDHWMTFVHPNDTAPWQSKGITTSYAKAKPWPSYQVKKIPWKDWDDESWTKYQREAADKDIKEFTLDDCEDELLEITIQLAEAGYRLQYTITNDPLNAKEWLVTNDFGTAATTATNIWED